MSQLFPKQLIGKWFKSNDIDFFKPPYNKIIESLKKQTYKKNEIILNIGDKENKIYFITSGCIRSFFIHNNQEFSLRFSFEGDVLSSFHSFLLNSNSTDGLQALADTEVFYLEKQDYFSLKKEHPEFEKIESDVFKILYHEKLEREKQFISLSTKEKYEQLLAKNKNIIKNIPVKYLASYLGIHPNSLSRLKKDVFTDSNKG